MKNNLGKIIPIYFFVSGVASLAALGYLLSIPGNIGIFYLMEFSTGRLRLAMLIVAFVLLLAGGGAIAMAFSSWYKPARVVQKFDSFLSRDKLAWVFIIIAGIIFLAGTMANLFYLYLPIPPWAFIRLQPGLIWIMFVAAETFLCLIYLLYQPGLIILAKRVIHMLIRWKSSVSREIVSHFRLLSIKKKKVIEYLSSPYRIILIILFVVLFLPHVFVVVNDTNFVIAYEVDPGVMIGSIISLYQQPYNMTMAYMSRWYGWTYFSINFFLLLPIYIVTALKIVPNNFYLFVSIRLLFFMIGLASVLAFFEVAKRTLKQNFLSFVAAILFIASPFTSIFFYYIHPETTGSLFLFIGILCLMRYNEGWAEDYRWYTFGLLSLVLSALSKQVFFFTAPPVIFLYIFSYCYHHKKSFFRFLISKQFTKVLFASIVFSILIFFIINPFAFIDSKKFVADQAYFFSFGSHISTITISEAVGAWIEKIKTIPIIILSLISLPFTILGAVIFGRDLKIGKALYIVNILSAVLFIFILSVTSRFYINLNYLAPIYPFLVLNLISVPLYIVRKCNVSLIKLLTTLSLIYFLFFILVGDFSVSLPRGYGRLMYQNSTIYKVFNYIEKNVPNGSKVAHDHNVAIPSEKKITACHFWQGCGTDYIEKFQPDYVIFDENWTFNGVSVETQRLLKYVNDHHFIIIDTIESVSVWKRPGN